MWSQGQVILTYDFAVSVATVQHSLVTPYFLAATTQITLKFPVAPRNT